MRPTKEMILETKQLVNQTDQNIKQIIKANDLELRNIRSKEEGEPAVNKKILFAAAITAALLLSYQAYRFFFSE